MGFFQKIGNGVARFMYGRNGGDQLSFAMVWGALLLNLSAGFIGSDIPHFLVSVLATVLAAVALFRMLSKNLARRRAENRKFCEKVWWPIKGKFTRLKDKDHKYFTCPTCRTVCRVPRGKGKIVITCPKCRGRIEGKS